MSTTLSFGSWLKQQRRRLDLTQEKFAQRVACSLSTLRKIEADDLLPSKELARSIAEALALPDAQQEAFIAFARGTRTALQPIPATIAQMPVLPLPTSSSSQVAPKPAPATPPNPPVSTNSVPPPTTTHRYRLPIPLTSLIGRQVEIMTAQQLLRQPGVRLLTLSGPPGTGKTRLALALAEAERDEFKDGVCFVALAAVNDPMLVVDALLRALGLASNPKADPLMMLKEFVCEKELLLVLDNFEQVVDASDLLVELLQEAAGLKILVTSRSLLNIYGEHELFVSPLPLPDLQHLPPLDELALYPAVALFVQRAQAVLPSFRLSAENARSVAQICQRLDGLPLAIEMAAARCKLYSPQLILEQLRQRLSTLGSGLRNLSPRQQTLHNAIEWSYNLLSANEQRMLNLVSVFVDGFTLEAANALLVQESAEAELWALAEKSLLRHERTTQDEARFSLLETIRTFADEKLKTAQGWSEAKERHALYYKNLAQQSIPFLMGSSRQMEWLQRLEPEQNNFRAALEWTIAEGSANLAMELADSLFLFWNMRGYTQEGQRWLESVISLNEDESIVRARIFNRMGTFAWHRGNLETAQQFQAQALAIQERIGDQPGISRSLQNLAIIAGMQSDYATTVQLLNRCLTIERTLGNLNAIKVIIQNLAIATERLGDNTRAEALFRESLQIRTEQNDQVGMAHVLNGLGNLLRKQGRLAEAYTAMRQALEIRRVTSNQREIALSLMAIAHVAVAMEESATSLRLYAVAQRINEELKIALTPDARQEDDRLVQQLRLRFGNEYEAQWQAARTLSTNDAIILALQS